MSELHQIQQVVATAINRRRWHRGWLGLWKGLFVGTLTYLIAVATFKLVPIPWEVVTWSAIAALLALPTGFFIGWFQPVSAIETARWLDRKEGLQERLSTAMEFTQKPVDPHWQQLVITDASQAASQIDTRRLIPWNLPRLARVCVLTLAVAACLGFLPEYRNPQDVQKQLDKKVIQETGRQLSNLTRRSLQNKKPVIDKTERALENVAVLGDKLQSAKLTRADALKDLASATEKLKQELGDMAKTPGMRRMEQAARTPGGSTSQSPQAMQRKMEELAKALGDKAAKHPDALDQLQKDLQALKQSAQGMADKDGAQGAAARAELSKAAAELARKAESMGMPMPSLDEAVAALNAAQVEQFLKDLNVAEQDLQKMAEMAKSLAQLQQQAEKIGKDLAEQLKNGQAQAAAESLKQMATQLQKANLSKEQLQKLLSDLDKALDPAKNYGAVADLLKKGAKLGKSGDKTASAQALADASKELEKMLEELGDMQGLMASLENLQKAQMAIGNSLPWGQCPSPRPGFNPNGKKGGKGVGTWGNDDPWAMPDRIDDFWDNSNVNRPDMAGRGHTERDSAVPDNLSPTKVRGQIQPGGPMPSITLRGVSIKGQSSVGFTEAAAAAQSDAQAALSQEQVPRAYQNAVKDYFDDLKK